MSEDLSSHFEKQLDNGDWQRIALVRKGDENSRVYAIYRENAIRGVFVIASGHGGQALVHVVCDVSPENVKSITAAATKIGLDNGLGQVLEMKMHGMKGPGGKIFHGPAGVIGPGARVRIGARPDAERSPTPPAPPEPPRPPRDPESDSQDARQ
jgi:hypothetical protein